MVTGTSWYAMEQLAADRRADLRASAGTRRTREARQPRLRTPWLRPRRTHRHAVCSA